ncbi:hypothetical protein ZWY2020_041128 [Hordeum vulgare]|nr:hypothetical protein ZWY2020_041128 [Hordeum vulgare]
MDPNRGADAVVDEVLLERPRVLQEDQGTCLACMDAGRRLVVILANLVRAGLELVLLQEGGGGAGGVGGGGGARVDLVVVNPVLVQGPALQPAVNASLHHVLKYLNSSAKTYANAVQGYVDVRDTAAARPRLRGHPPPPAATSASPTAVLHQEDVVTILRKFFPEYPPPGHYITGVAELRAPALFH